MFNYMRNSILILVGIAYIPLNAMEIPKGDITIKDLVLSGQNTENNGFQTQGRLSKLVESAENGDLIAQLIVHDILYKK